MPSSWTAWSARWLTTNASAMDAMVISPRFGWSPQPRHVGVGQAGQASPESLECAVDPVVELGRREGPVTFQDAQAVRVRGDAAERDGSGRHPRRTPRGCAPSRPARTGSSRRRGRGVRAGPIRPRGRRRSARPGATGPHPPRPVESRRDAPHRRASAGAGGRHSWWAVSHERRSMGVHDHPPRTAGEPT